MFDTGLGSIILLSTMLGIILILALLATAWLRWVFLTDEEAAETTTVHESPVAPSYRKAA